jgi:hypothetical protein
VSDFTNVFLIHDTPKAQGTAHKLSKVFGRFRNHYECYSKILGFQVLFREIDENIRMLLNVLCKYN